MTDALADRDRERSPRDDQRIDRAGAHLRRQRDSDRRPRDAVFDGVGDRSLRPGSSRGQTRRIGSPPLADLAERMGRRAIWARIGDEVTLDYFLWSDEDGLRPSSATFTLRRHRSR